MRAINPEEAPPAVGPYSQAVESENKLYTCLMGPFDEDGNIIEGTIGEQTHRTMENLKVILEAAGSSLENIVHTRAYLADLDAHFDGFNDAYQQHVSEPYPARTTLPLYELFDERVKVEIELVAET